jgi:hypothetical protein
MRKNNIDGPMPMIDFDVKKNMSILLIIMPKPEE